MVDREGVGRDNIQMEMRESQCSGSASFVLFSFLFVFFVGRVSLARSLLLGRGAGIVESAVSSKSEIVAAFLRAYFRPRGCCTPCLTVNQATGFSRHSAIFMQQQHDLLSGRSARDTRQRDLCFCLSVYTFTCIPSRAAMPRELTPRLSRDCGRHQPYKHTHTNTFVYRI